MTTHTCSTITRGTARRLGLFNPERRQNQQAQAWSAGFSVADLTEDHMHQLSDAALRTALHLDQLPGAWRDTTPD